MVGYDVHGGGSGPGGALAAEKLHKTSGLQRWGKEASGIARGAGDGFGGEAAATDGTFHC